MPSPSGEWRAHLVFASSSLSKIPCRCSSSMRVMVTSFSLALDSLVEMGGVTPRYLMSTCELTPPRFPDRFAYPIPEDILRWHARQDGICDVQTERRGSRGKQEANSTSGLGAGLCSFGRCRVRSNMGAKVVQGARQAPSYSRLARERLSSELDFYHHSHMLAHGRAHLLTRKILQSRNAHIARNHKEDPRWPGWELVVGIEVHAQIKSRRKLFSGEHICRLYARNGFN